MKILSKIKWAYEILISRDVRQKLYAEFNCQGNFNITTNFLIIMI